MNRSDLIDHVRQNAPLTKEKATELVDGIFARMTEGLTKDGEVLMHGFGRLGVRERKARTAKNPRTGESVQVPAGKKIFFRPGPLLRSVVEGR